MTKAAQRAKWRSLERINLEKAPPRKHYRCQLRYRCQARGSTFRPHSRRVQMLQEQRRREELESWGITPRLGSLTPLGELR